MEDVLRIGAPGGSFQARRDDIFRWDPSRPPNETAKKYFRGSQDPIGVIREAHVSALRAVGMAPVRPCYRLPSGPPYVPFADLLNAGPISAGANKALKLSVGYLSSHEPVCGDWDGS